ncbi:MAG: endonuclease/exonuclease/phosphatase family protein [Rhodobacteraceae bacterium]|nr:endonuclease/exonuclease/phosphatase family protein [Paracoccaceae bacterium]
MTNRTVLAIAYALATILALPAMAQNIRIAQFNASMSRGEANALLAALDGGTDPQITQVAEIITLVSPDILLINEFDYDPAAPALFLANYLAEAGYTYYYIAPSNTGLASGVDINADGHVATAPGRIEYANDAFGFGFFPGQFGMLVLSRHEILTDRVRRFQTFRWADMPDARLPMNENGTPYYGPEAINIFRLSSKSHWDVPIRVGDQVIHLLASHPTPPVFDGPEDRNGTRNADEIRFWADYVQGAAYIQDDAGATGSLTKGAHFIVAGDLNADPFDGDSFPGAARQLLDLPLINTSLTPGSRGGLAAALAQGQANDSHQGNPTFDTADFGDEAPGNLRVDYVLPSATLGLTDAGVFWPAPGEEGADLISASDHRLVWIDVTLPR